ncbi:MAG: DUF3786 domain-containing protein [Actinomycetota bacterium]|nr:DUF3786 domain-containing protein [Actinomycetota bacterium]
MDVYNRIFDELIVRDIKSISIYSGSELLDEHRIKLDFFEKKVVVDLYKREVFYLERDSEEGTLKVGESPDMHSASLILHYLQNADGSPLTGRWVPYRELPGGLFYCQTIPGVLNTVVKKYESDGAGFLKRACEIGGQKYDRFKFASIIFPFKMFPVLMILEEKDVEFEADARALFDSSAPHYLKTDVIKLIIVYMVNKLCR